MRPKACSAFTMWVFARIASGWGDGYYPVYFGYDAKGEVCAVYVRFIDIEASYKEQE